MPNSTLRPRLRLRAFAIATIIAIPVACEFSTAAHGDEPNQSPAAGHADAKSTSLSDEHAADESPRLGVIVGSCPGEGVCVLDTVWGSPADEAGIVHGDYILSFNGTDVSTPRELMDALKQAKGGDKAIVEVWSQGETKKREITLASKADQPPSSHSAWLGVMLSPDQEGDGVTIERVMSGSPAANANLRNGDIIIKRDEQAISDVRSFAESIEDMEPGSELRLTVKRDGRPMQLKVTVGDIDEAPMRFRRQAQAAMQSNNGGSQSNFGQDASSPMLDETIDEILRRIRELENQVRDLSTRNDVSQRSNVLAPQDTTLVVKRDQGHGRDRYGWNRGRRWDNDYYDWQSRYRSGYRSPLYRSPRYGNWYYRYGGRPYYGNFGRYYGYGRGGVRIGNFGVWW